MRGNAHVSRTHAHPAPCVFYFYVFARCTLDLSKALILSTIRLGQNMCVFRDFLWGFWGSISRFLRLILVGFIWNLRRRCNACSSTRCVNTKIRDELLWSNRLVLYSNVTIFKQMSRFLRVHFWIISPFFRHDKSTNSQRRKMRFLLNWRT